MENDRNNNNNNSSSSSIVSLENLNHAASWVSSTVISAFFSSLERFSCVNVATSDLDDDDDEYEAKNRPVALPTNPPPSHDVASLPV